jgi:hypothetical protein
MDDQDMRPLRAALHRPAPAHSGTTACASVKSSGVPMSMKGGAQRPHVLVVHTGEGPVRGAERVALTLMRVLRSSWRVTLLTNHAALHDAALAAGEASLYDDLLGLPAGVPSGSRGRRLAAAARILATVWHLSRLLREQEVALVHLSNGHAAGLMLLPALVAGVPMLAHLHAPLSRRTQIRFGIFAADRIVGVAAFLGDVWAPPIVRGSGSRRESSCFSPPPSSPRPRRSTWQSRRWPPCMARAAGSTCWCSATGRKGLSWRRRQPVCRSPSLDSAPMRAS